MLRRTGFARKTYTPPPPAPLRRVTCNATYATTSSEVVVVPKRVYVRSLELLAAVRTLPCQITGRTGGTEPAHSNWSVHGKAGRIKADDNRVAAIHWTLHRELDQGSRWSARERRELWWTAHCSTVMHLYCLGMWPHDVPLPSLVDFDP